MALVLVHPVAMGPDCWWRLRLPPVTTVTPQLAGHGGRPYPGQPLSLEELADDLADQLTTVDGPLDLVGLAFGGCVAQYFALRHPRRLRSLLLANTTSRSDPATMRQRAREAAPGMASVVDTTLPRWFTPEALAQPDHPGVAYARERLLDQDPRMYADCWQAMAGHDVTAQLARLQVPATVVGGTRDRSATLDKVRDIHAHLPRSELVTVDAPHMVQLEAPDALSGAVARHLERVRARTEGEPYQ